MRRGEGETLPGKKHGAKVSPLATAHYLAEPAASWEKIKRIHIGNEMLESYGDCQNTRLKFV